VKMSIVVLAMATTMMAQAPPRMFGPWYAEALRDVLKLEESDAARLEESLAANPDDQSTRLKLMAYYQRADRINNAGDRAKRAQHALWLIEHHPESEILHSPYARFAPAELMADQYAHATVLWDALTKTNPNNAAIQWNAASFFESLDSSLYLRYLEATVAADPNHPFALRPLAHLYALSILDGSSAVHAQAALDTSKNIWILGNAAYMLQSQYNQSLQAGRPNRRAAELAERYFLKAKVIDPTLNRSAILPEIDVQAIARVQREAPERRRDVQAGFEAAALTIRRVPINAFRDLPPAVAQVLEGRHCTIPQTSQTAINNVIRGEFFRKGEAGWAALCSAGGKTALLAFRNYGDTTPDTILSNEDKDYLQGTGEGKIEYSRQITGVGRDFIMGHYRAYGGPEPPPIDHQGIDDAFVGKASVTWYFYDGKWLRLQGAD
jgi:hypothetical protein